MNIRQFASGDAPFLIEMYQACFSGPPWNQVVTQEEAEKQWNEHSKKPGFSCLVAESGEKILGASWFDVMTPEGLEEERGRELADFVRRNHPGRRKFWIRETIVSPESQGLGIASALKETAVESIGQLNTPTILLTRMRDDNVRIIRANEKLGFLRTGIKVQSRSNPSVVHEYWYKLIH